MFPALGSLTPQLTSVLSDRPLLFAAESLFQQMFGLEVWMCLRYPWSLITTYPTTENCTYTGKLGVHSREHGWVTLTHGGFIVSPASQNWPLRPLRPKRCSNQLCEEWRHPHPERHWAVLLHPDRRDAHERWVQACPKLLPSSAWRSVRCIWKSTLCSARFVPNHNPSSPSPGEKPSSTCIFRLGYSSQHTWCILTFSSFQLLILSEGPHSRGSWTHHTLSLASIIVFWTPLHLSYCWSYVLELGLQLGTCVNNVFSPAHVFQ